jgi:hypothetical protein
MKKSFDVGSMIDFVENRENEREDEREESPREIKKAKEISFVSEGREKRMGFGTENQRCIRN